MPPKVTSRYNNLPASTPASTGDVDNGKQHPQERKGKLQDKEKEKPQEKDHAGESEKHVMRTLQSLSDVLQTYDPNKNVTNPVMTKYERAIVLGQRIEQLARGSQPFIDISVLSAHEPLSSELIAEKELLERKLPFVVKRTLPNGKPEYWRIQDMIVY